MHRRQHTRTEQCAKLSELIGLVMLGQNPWEEPGGDLFTDQVATGV